MAVADLSNPRTLDAVRTASMHVPELIDHLARVDPQPATQPNEATVEGRAELTRQLSDVLATVAGAKLWPKLLTVLLGENAAAGPANDGWRAHTVLHENIVERDLTERVQRSALVFIVEAAPASVTVSSATGAEDTVPSWQLSENASLGLRAFELLAATENPPTLLDQLSPECWRTWTDILLFLAPRDTGQRMAYETVVAYAYEADPAGFPDAVIEQVKIQYGVGFDPEALEVVDGCWDKGPLERDLLLRATAVADHAGITETVLRKLMRRDPGQAAYRAAVEALGMQDEGNQPTSVALGAAMALLTLHWRLESPYSPLWSVLADNPKLLRHVLTANQASRRKDGWFSALHTAPPELLPRLYTTACDLFPPEQDPIDARNGPRERLLASEARDAILREIANRADTNSLAFLQGVSALESRPGVFDRLLKIAYTAAISNWVPTSLENLAALVADPARRIVNDSARLLELILESLSEFEADLQGDAALAHLLWNQTDDWCHPKPEPSLSDLTAWFLDLKLAGHRVVINREVQVRRVKAKGLPDSVDIKAEAPGSGSADDTAPQVMIEVKGAWNGQLMDAIETQLHTRYLTQPGSVGLYLVGYYSCQAWEQCEPVESRRAERGGIDELRQVMTKRASQLVPAPATVVIDVRLHTTGAR